MLKGFLNVQVSDAFRFVLDSSLKILLLLLPGGAGGEVFHVDKCIT